MKSKKLLDIIKNNDLIIPSILLLNYKNLKINEKELLFLSLLMNIDGEIIFDPVHLSKKLSFGIEETMEIISDLSTKSYIEIVVKKEDTKMKEYISIDSFYEKLMLLVMDEEEVNTEDSTIYSVIEEEFGRTLSPIECETIAGWLNAKVGEDLIKEALKEAVLNGVNNLKYIDKIIYEWTKKGYKKASDIKKKIKKEPEEIELFEYDWLDENDG